MHKPISLSEAEENLRKGYVFLCHSCPLCVAEQPEADLEEYDAVSFEYSWGGEMSVPFYVFYKKLYEYDNGCVTYAKAYVCALKLDELDGYLKSR